MDTREKAIELHEMYLRRMDNLGYKNWEELCAGENLSSYEEERKWLTDFFDESWRVNDEMETCFLEEQLQIELGNDKRFNGLVLQLCHDIALAYRSIDWREEYKLQILEENVEEYNREYDNEEDMISLHEYVRIESDNDPNFFFWLFDRNEALVDENGYPTELGQEIFNEFLESL